MNKSVEVMPFFERSGKGEEGLESETYVAGFRQADGSPIGVKVVLPAEMVERAVLADSGLSVSLNPDGTFTLHADGLSDDTLDAASAALRQTATRDTWPRENRGSRTRGTSAAAARAQCRRA